MKKAQNYLPVFLLFFVFAPTLQAQIITRGPYLQQLSNKGVIIRWRTNLAVGSLVKFYQQDSTQTVIVSDDMSTTEHIIQLTNLQADTRYHYSVGTSTTTLASGKDFYFITGPDKYSNRPIHIWAMGDFGDESTQIYMETQKGIRESYLKNRPDFTDLWLWLGDNAYCCGTDAEYQKQVFDFYGSSIFGNTAFFPSPGNHEYFASPTGRSDRKIPYYDIISVPGKGEMGGIPSNQKAYYSYDYGNIHIISLDSDGFDNGKRLYEPQSPQYQWLKQDLAANKSMWTIVMFHHPPYTKRSHDSDAELELQYIRENLVPLFDQYKVDLVLTGHSHIYERSYLMKGHTGHSMSFNYDAHVIQKVNGKYDAEPGSKPFINKDEGTIYCTVGSAGRLDWNGSHDVHPSSIYSNISIGGSLLLTVNSNRLDGRWICADNVERDHFSIFKNVNKRQNLHAEYGSKIHLNSSWKGSHIWSNGNKKDDEIDYQAFNSETVIVKDSLGFLEDDFIITVTPQPVINTDFSLTSVCPGQPLSVAFTVQNTDIKKWNYSLELSDSNGSFEKPLVLAKASQSPIRFALSDSLKEGNNYKFRIRPDVDFFDERPSKEFRLNKPATGGFISEKTIPFDTLINLTLRFTGTPPYIYKLSQLPEVTTQNSEVTIKVKPIEATTYTLESLTNVCGNGIIAANGSKVSILAPLFIEEESTKVFSIFPNPTYGDLIIENQTAEPIKTHVTLIDLKGKKIMNKTVIIDKREIISLQDIPAGDYVLNLKTSSLKVSRKVTKM
ncbi:metallophosphoesterase [Emticicia sp. BO119]|uniref:metallophosphoesterase n=1 Tax=Emticicia sp. BO119 TaxID=2757768 RepID=UPI0015F11392|nr:metallophosphoesterase [Emticicia sp. BO119]MBA4853297.1 metallophosphoesterase [Emticicia sp. BO119]